MRWTIVAVLLVASSLAATCREPEIEYARGYREKAFMQLGIGASMEDAKVALGEPLEWWPHTSDHGKIDEVYWAYARSEQINGTHYRVLIFSPDGKLKGRETDYDSD